MTFQMSQYLLEQLIALHSKITVFCTVHRSAWELADWLRPTQSLIIACIIKGIIFSEKTNTLIWFVIMQKYKWSFFFSSFSRPFDHIARIFVVGLVSQWKKDRGDNVWGPFQSLKYFESMNGHCLRKVCNVNSLLWGKEERTPLEI